ncbi:MAG: MFS transporter [Phycisphaeraceae bacterium]|nr:MFS transporter [Phycisphaeraceae bacterium]
MKPATESAPAPSSAHESDPDRHYILAALMLVMSLASLEQTVTSTAMPTIIGELQGLEHYAWVASIYLLASIITMPLYGRLTDKLGRKRVILFTIVLFTAGSVLASFSRNMHELILYRGIQGLGAGGIMPVVLTILADIYSLEERARVQGFFSAVWGIAALTGPPLGAFLVKTLGWRSIFYVNFPFAMLGIAVLSWKYVDRSPRHAVDLNLPGIISLAVACTALLAVLSGMGPGGWPVPLLVTCAVVAVIAFTYFLLHERRARQPILPPEIIFNRAIGPSLMGMFLLGLCVMSVDTYVPLYVQGARGGGPGSAAGVVTPVILTWAISNFAIAPFFVSWGFRKTALIGATLVLTGLTGVLICTLVEAPQVVLSGILAVVGLGFGPCSLAYLLSAQDAAPLKQRGSVTGSASFFRSMGGALGVGLLGALINILMLPEIKHLHELGFTPGDALDPSRHTSLPPELLHKIQHAIGHALLWVFITMAALAFIQVFISMVMPRKYATHKPSASDAFEAAG